MGKCSFPKWIMCPRRLALLIGCCLFVLCCFPQKRVNFFYGRVMDAATRTGLREVNLNVEGSRTGTVTDRKGEFSFYTDSIPAMLIVSHVGYETKRILLDTTSYSLTLYLMKKAVVLQEVEVKARMEQPFFKDERYAVLDYAIDSGRVFLLVYRNYLTRSELICLGLNGDTLAVSEPLPFRPDRLIRDCLGMLHVHSHDSDYQVFRHDRQLELIHPFHLRKFDHVLKDCVAATPEVLYFQRVTDRGLGVEYFGVNRNTMQRSSLARVKDEKKLRMLRRDARESYLLSSRVQPDSREDFVTWNFVHKVLYRPVKSALFTTGGFVCLINIPDRQIEFYDSQGQYSCKLALQTEGVAPGRWTADIYPDEVTGKIYTTFLQNGTCHLCEVNIHTGELKKRASLFHVYPARMKVYDGWVYYLYDVAGNADNKMLYRERF